MRVLWCQTEPYLPDNHGGGLSNTHAACVALKARGCEVAVLARRQLSWMRSLWPTPSDLGYAVTRSTDPLRDLETLRKSFSPDVAIVQFGDIGGMVDALNRLNVPSLVYLHDMPTISAANRAATAYAACSSVVADLATAAVGRPTSVIPVLIDPERYRVERSGNAVTLVNPIPRKGVEIAFALAARRPDIRFEFVEAWQLRKRALKYLRARIAHHGNIELLLRTDDMKSVYRRSRLILAPSLWLEAWGRVVSEAQVSGIPALASDSGGLPQAVGPGGTIVARDASMADWSAAFERLVDDSAFHASKSAAALAHAARPEFQPKAIIDRLLAVLTDLKRR